MGKKGGINIRIGKDEFGRNEARLNDEGLDYMAQGLADMREHPEAYSHPKKRIWG